MMSGAWGVLMAAVELDTPYKYNHPFIQPLPVWDYWYLLLLPLCLAVSIVYKSIKCHSMKRVWREASVIFIMIIGGIVLASVLLSGMVKWLEN